MLDMILKPALGTPLDARHPLSRDLVACWLMSERGGAVVQDASGNRNDVSFVGPVWVAGQRGPALQADGLNDDGAVSLDLTAYSVLTLCFSMYRSAWDNDDDLFCEFTNNYNNNSGSFIIDPDAGAPATGKMTVGTNISSDRHTNSYVRPSTGWHDYAAVLDVSTDPNRIELYIDGVLQTSTPVLIGNTTGTFANDQLNFFSRNGSSLFLDCKCGYFYIYGRELLPQEVTHLYKAPFCMFRSTLIEPYMSYEGVTPNFIPIAMHHQKMLRS